MPNQLLFRAYTLEQVRQCRHFLLKYLGVYNLKPPATTAIVVYTNAPHLFEAFTNFFPLFQMPELLETAAGQKAETAPPVYFLQQALAAGGSVLYCDTATYPLQPPDAIFNAIAKGALYLHSPHPRAQNELAAALRAALPPRDKTAVKTAQPAGKQNVWSTAVIGIGPKAAALLDAVAAEAVNTKLLLNLAFTHAFEKAGAIKPAAKAIFDYSLFPEFSKLLETFFKKNEEESIPNQVKALHHVDAEKMWREKEAWHKKPLLQKWLLQVQGKGWSTKKQERAWS